MHFRLRGITLGIRPLSVGIHSLAYLDPLLSSHNTNIQRYKGDSLLNEPVISLDPQKCIRDRPFRKLLKLNTNKSRKKATQITRHAFLLQWREL